jgi:hypothetical protein
MWSLSLEFHTVVEGLSMGEQYSVVVDGEVIAEHLGRLAAISFAWSRMSRKTGGTPASIITIYEEATAELRVCWRPRGCGWSSRSAAGWL